jgi:hypothetical protein
MKWRRQPPGEMGDHVPQTAAVRVFYPPIQNDPFVNHSCVLLELDDFRPFTPRVPAVVVFLSQPGKFHEGKSPAYPRYVYWHCNGCRRSRCDAVNEMQRGGPSWNGMDRVGTMRCSRRRASNLAQVYRLMFKLGGRCNCTCIDWFLRPPENKRSRSSAVTIRHSSSPPCAFPNAPQQCARYSNAAQKVTFSLLRSNQLHPLQPTLSAKPIGCPAVPLISLSI